ncbi:hypothetical protein DdX_17536 [Ditylenchus destructor]|uniref:Uncharacterized protein n=1 Tax=Ditylenchus destructor TaxID=166010 RepID=A0AAD4MM92_9BILA|nr:hypothetical protein DdX_17535 [Ditylenchus destructor]KAI1699106.1 hypothetical protein DdX_17536 [Ditylenchus destructor]
MNSICLALCLVTVISFNVVVAPFLYHTNYRCPTPYNGAEYKSYPISFRCDQNNPGGCEEDEICLSLVTKDAKDPVVKDPVAKDPLPPKYGCCMLSEKNKKTATK